MSEMAHTHTQCAPYRGRPVGVALYSQRMTCLRLLQVACLVFPSPPPPVSAALVVLPPFSALFLQRTNQLINERHFRGRKRGSHFES